MGLAVMEGVWVGYSANLNRQMENSALAGVNRFMTAVSQISSIANAIYISQLALKASLAFSHPLPLIIRSTLYLTPVMTNALCAKLDLKTHPYFKRALLIINTHIGAVCQVAIVVSSVSLIVFGQPIVGSVSLAFVIVGFVQRRCWLPLKLSNGINTVGFIGVNTARLVLGDYFSKFTALCEVGNFAYLQIARIRKPVKEPAPVQNQTLSILDVPSSFVPDSIDLHHLSKEELILPPPEIDLDTLQILFRQFNEQNPLYYQKMKKFVRQDEHWQEYFSNKNSDAEIFDYVQTGLKNFIENVSNSTIRSGEMSDYQSLQRRARHIAFQLPSKSVADQFSNLMHLALASYYCPAGYVEKVRSVYYTVCNATEEDTLESKVTQVLDQARRHLFQSFLQKLWSNNPLRNLTDPCDNHIYNEFVNLLGDFFHLSEEKDAQQDALSYLDILSKKMIQVLYRPLIKPFIEAYNQNFIVENVYEALTNRQIPHQLIERWFIEEYVAALQSKDAQQEDVNKNVDNQRLFEEATTWVHANVYDEMTGKIEERYLNYFLVKMKVFKI